MKIAAFSDLHAHIYKDFDTHSDVSGSSRLDNIVNTLVYIREYCNENGIDTILFGGDLFHIRARVSTVVMNSMYDTIKTFWEKYQIEIIMIPGNHDDTDNSDLPNHSLHTFKDIEGVTVVDTLSTVTLKDGTPVVCVRYSKNATMIKDFIQSLDAQDFDKTPILLGHLGINGGYVGKGSYAMADAFEVKDLRPAIFKYIILGHYHRSQYLGDNPHVLYTGAPIQHSFSDEGEDKGFYVLDTSKRWDIKFVPVPNPKFITIQDVAVQHEDLQEFVENGDYVRIQCREQHLESTLSFLPENLNYKIELIREYVEETRVEVKIGMSEEEVITKYANEFNPHALETGMKILKEIKEG